MPRTISVNFPDIGQVLAEHHKGNTYRAVRQPSVQDLHQELTKQPSRAVLRCELFYLLQERFADRLPTSYQLTAQASDAVQQLVDQGSYYHASVAWLHQSPNFLNLYSWKDLEFPVTYLELGYLLYYVLEQPAVLDWGVLSTQIADSAPISVVYLKDHGREVVSSRLTSHMGKFQTMDRWLQSIRLGSSHIPLIAYCATADLFWGYLNDPQDLSEVLFKEVSASELESIFGVLS